MKTKQLVSIIVTGAVIVVVGVTGVFSNVVANSMSARSKNVGSTLKELVKEDLELELPAEDFVGVINVVGEIGASADSFMPSGTYDHDLYMKYIETMEEDRHNKGILLYVDSPGGAVYQSDELYLKLMEYKERTGRPIWAYFASEACSGGYYVAMAADRIYANRNCWTGSIGVIVSLVNCKELYDKLGIQEVDITSGRNKAMGSAGLDLTQEQYDILQGLVDEAYDQFVEIIAAGRGLGEDTVRQLADGRIYSAKQARENLLIDQIGSLEEEKQAFSQEAGFDEDIVYYAPENREDDWLQYLFSKAEKLVPRSELDLAADIVENQGNGVLKYYAK